MPKFTVFSVSNDLIKPLKQLFRGQAKAKGLKIKLYLEFSARKHFRNSLNANPHLYEYCLQNRSQSF